MRIIMRKAYPAGQTLRTAVACYKAGKTQRVLKNILNPFCIFLAAIEGSGPFSVRACTRPAVVCIGALLNWNLARKINRFLGGII